MRAAAILAFLLFAFAVRPAWAEDKTLNDFFGEWTGAGTAKDGVAAIQDRASTVTIERLGDGFKVTWSTMRAQADSPSATVLKTTTLKFKGTENAKVFHATDTADPLKGGRAAWATLTGATLRVQLFNVEPDGAGTLQIYDRTLSSATAMDASFRRVTNGEVVRKADLKLTKSP
jgi:hypothetical protein